MSVDEARDKPPKSKWRRRLLFLAPLVLLAAVLVVVGLRLWKEYDPFVMDRPAMKEAKGLLDASRAGPLGDREFDRAIALLGSDTPAAQLAALTTVQLEAERTPARRERAIAALDGLPESAPANVRQAAQLTAGRLREPPKAP